MSGEDSLYSNIREAAAEHYNAEAGDLRTQRNGVVAASVEPPYVTTMENFASMDHASIYAVVQAMHPEGLFGFATLWTSLGSEIASVFSQFSGSLGGAMEGWTGGSRDSAQAAARAFSTTGQELGGLAGGLAPRMTELASAVSALRLSVPPPATDGGQNEYGLIVPGGELLKSAADEELRMQAVAAMTSIYEPSYGTAGVGSNVPAYFAPADPAPGFGDGSTMSSTSLSSRNGGSNASTTDSGATDSGAWTPLADDSSNPQVDVVDSSSPSESGTAAADSVSSDPGSTDRQSSSDPDAVRSASFTPQSALPSQLGSDATRFMPDSTTPRTTSPVTPTPSQPIVQPANPGQSSMAAMSPAARAASSTTTRGTGPFMPGAGGHRDEDSEHKIPEYLITEENGRELFGELPKTAPPVFGDWTERT